MKILDKIDLRILEILLKDSRTTSTKIATMINRSEATVRNRISKLVETGVIKQFGLELNAKLVGYRIVAYVGADLADPASQIKTLNYLKELQKKELQTDIRIPKIFLAHGDHDILMEIWGKDLETFHKFIHEKIETYKNISRICPAIIVDKI